MLGSSKKYAKWKNKQGYIKSEGWNFRRGHGRLHWKSGVLVSVNVIDYWGKGISGNVIASANGILWCSLVDG